MRTGATFRLWGSSGGTAAAVTEALGLPLTQAFEAGQPESAQSRSVRIERLLSVLEPIHDRLWHLVGEGYEAN